MSVNQSNPVHTPITYVLRRRYYRLIMLGSGLIYALVYMFVVGIVSYYPGFAPLNVAAPIVTANTLGIMIIPGDYIFIFAYYSAIIFLTASSFFVGLNTALLLYSNNLSKAYGYCRNNNSSLKGILGIIPAFFTSFSCCGGGLLIFVIGPTAFSSLALYGNYVAIVTVAVLAVAGTAMSRKINQLNTAIGDYYYCIAEGERRVKK